MKLCDCQHVVSYSFTKDFCYRHSDAIKHFCSVNDVGSLKLKFKYIDYYLLIINNHSHKVTRDWGSIRCKNLNWILLHLQGLYTWLKLPTLRVGRVVYSSPLFHSLDLWRPRELHVHIQFFLENYHVQVEYCTWKNFANKWVIWRSPTNLPPFDKICR